VCHNDVGCRPSSAQTVKTDPVATTILSARFWLVLSVRTNKPKKRRVREERNVAQQIYGHHNEMARRLALMAILVRSVGPDLPFGSAAARITKWGKNLLAVPAVVLCVARRSMSKWPTHIAALQRIITRPPGTQTFWWFGWVVLVRYGCKD